MAAEIREHARTFAIGFLANGIDVDPDKAKRDAFAAGLGAADLSYADRRVAGWAEDLRVPYLSLVAPLRTWAEAHGSCVDGFANAVPCFGHFNEQGHRITGQALATMICDEVSNPSH